MGRWVEQRDCETQTLSYFPSQNGPGLWWVVSCCIMPLISWVDCFLKQSLAKELSYQSLESALVGRDLGLVNTSFRSSLKIHWRTRVLRPRYHKSFLQICMLNKAKIAESCRNGKHGFQRARAVSTKDTSPHRAHSQRPFTCRHTLVSFVSRSRCYLLTPDALYWLKTPLLYRPNIGWALSQYAWRVDPITLEKMFCKEHQQAPNGVFALLVVVTHTHWVQPINTAVLTTQKWPLPAWTGWQMQAVCFILYRTSQKRRPARSLCGPSLHRGLTRSTKS